MEGPTISESNGVPELSLDSEKPWSWSGKAMSQLDAPFSQAMVTFIFVLRKKGSKTKERMKEEEIEKGDCGPPTRKVFFWFCRT